MIVLVFGFSVISFFGSVLHLQRLTPHHMIRANAQLIAKIIELLGFSAIVGG